LECLNCHSTVAEGGRFCGVCGTAIPLAAGGTSFSSEARYPDAVIPPHPYVAVKEDLARRVAAYLLDLAPVVVVALFHFVPILGWMFFGLVASAWWLLRDMNGASLGKSIVGSVVLSADGSPSTTNQRILRNLPLCLPALLEMIPLLGIVIAPIVGVVIFGVEAIMLLVSGRRLGDMLAGTDVFRRDPAITTATSSL
jgi:uncharacterized RDD family membrane protein YckC